MRNLRIAKAINEGLLAVFKVLRISESRRVVHYLIHYLRDPDRVCGRARVTCESCTSLISNVGYVIWAV
jgi:hypothetical protein